MCNEFIPVLGISCYGRQGENDLGVTEQECGVPPSEQPEPKGQWSTAAVLKLLGMFPLNMYFVSEFCYNNGACVGNLKTQLAGAHHLFLHGLGFYIPWAPASLPSSSDLCPPLPVCVRTQGIGIGSLCPMLALPRWVWWVTQPNGASFQLLIQLLRTLEHGGLWLL